MTTATSEEDINDAFFGITLAENRFSEVGYEEGFTKGVQRGQQEGYRLGITKGAQIGAEVSFYKGYSLAVRSFVTESEPSERLIRVLDSLDSALEQFPKDSTPNSSMVETLDAIRSKFKQMCSLTNTNVVKGTKKSKLDF